MHLEGSGLKLLFVREPNQGLRLLVLFLLSLTCLFADYNYNLGEGFRARAIGFFYVLQKTATSPLVFFKEVKGHFQENQSLRLKLENMESENRRLKSQLLTMGYLETENERLRLLLGTKPRAKEAYQIAELVSLGAGAHPRANSHQVILNKGKVDQVFKGQMVIDSQGLVGQVVELGENHSKVLLITDPDSGVPVEILRNGIKTNALGMGQSNLLSLYNVPRAADIKEGDLVVTSGLGGKYMPGYPVGKVSAVSNKNGEHFLQVFVEPLAALESSKLVLLVNNNNPNNNQITGEINH
ncbi:MAG: rod shape-determining protein MreC [Gammaproteobacteria bacterium]